MADPTKSDVNGDFMNSAISTTGTLGLNVLGPESMALSRSPEVLRELASHLRIG